MIFFLEFQLFLHKNTAVHNKPQTKKNDECNILFIKLS